ncbi:unnamed protein product, partial [Allacma fusca]
MAVAFQYAEAACYTVLRTSS